MNNNDLVITRQFDAPRERVFDAWTQNEHMRVWSCPRDFTVTFADGDLRPGGAFRSGMRAPDGIEHIVVGEYREIDPPSRLVFTHQWEYEGGRRSPETRVVVELADEGGGTHMTFTQTGFESKESSDGHEGGWSEAFDNLQTYLTALEKN